MKASDDVGTGATAGGTGEATDAELSALRDKLAKRVPNLDGSEIRATPLDGIGLFPLQATMNHSCEPNVTLVKEEGDEERDGRVVARTTRDVAAGEELCNTYVDVTLPVRRRRRELREYGFECDCARCVRELQALADKKASGDKKAGKRRLK